MIIHTNMSMSTPTNTSTPMPINMTAKNIPMNTSMSTAMPMSMNILIPMSIPRIPLTTGTGIRKSTAAMSTITGTMAASPIPIPMDR